MQYYLEDFMKLKDLASYKDLYNKLSLFFLVGWFLEQNPNPNFKRQHKKNYCYGPQ